MIKLRAVAVADLGLLRHWDTQPHVIAAGSDDWGWEEELQRSPSWREQLIAELDGRAIGFVQIIDPAQEDSHYWGEVDADLRAIDIWIGEVDALGQGHGSDMMRQVIERCFSDDAVSAIIIDPLASNTRAHRFYQRLGFRFIENRRFGEDDCKVFRLDRLAQGFG